MNAALWLYGLLTAAWAEGPRVEVVNMVPRRLSGEINQDSEPTITVDPRDPCRLAGAAFTPGYGLCGLDQAPIYLSEDGGRSWAIACTLPAGFEGIARDVFLAFGPSSGALYAAILRLPAPPGENRYNLLRARSWMEPMEVVTERLGVDQPFVRALALPEGKERLYISSNDFSGGSRTATLDRVEDAASPAPKAEVLRLEARENIGQDGPAVRVAVHPSGQAYAAFYRWITKEPDRDALRITTDVVLLRDDPGGEPFSALRGEDGAIGLPVARGRTLRFATGPALGQERLGGSLSLAVDPSDARRLLLAWADDADGVYTLHLRRSDDGGLGWTEDLVQVPWGINAAVAIAEDGSIGFLYQQLVEGDGGASWETHLLLGDRDLSTRQDLVLSRTPADDPPWENLPYLGDYVDLLAMHGAWYGAFAARNLPDPAAFPQGVRFQREVDMEGRRLLDGAGAPLRCNLLQGQACSSIDPFFFRVEGGPLSQPGSERPPQCSPGRPAAP